MYEFIRQTLVAAFPRLAGFVFRYKVGIKYLISGGTAAVVDLGLLYLLTDVAGLWYLLSAVIAFVFSLLTSFLLHKFWTFRERSLTRMKKQFIFFTALALFNLGLNVALMYVLVETFGVWYLIAQFFIIGGIALMNFVINKSITFRSERANKKNILLATGIYPPDSGGPATYVRILEEALPLHGFNVKVITYGEGSDSEGVTYISRNQSRLVRYLSYFWQILHLLQWADIVYVQGPVSEGLPVYWACKLRGRKYILKVVGDYAWEQGVQRYGVKELLDDFQNTTYGKEVEKMRRIQKMVVRGAEKVVTPSFYLKGVIKQWGVEADTINVVYNAVEFKNAEVLKKPPTEKWLISVGRLVPWKGMDILIDVMPLLLRDDASVKLKILGDGPERTNLEKLIHSLGLENSVELLGQKPHDEVLAYIKTADIFVLHSNYEGLSHVILEAFNCGTPVIATKAGGNVELVDGHDNGLLVDFGDREQLAEAIKKLLQDPSLRDAFSSHAQRYVTPFLKEQMITKTIEVLTS